MNPYTTIAIQKFENVKKKQYQLAKAEDELERAITKIPQVEIPSYYEKTEEIDQTYEKKIDQIHKVRHRR